MGAFNELQQAIDAVAAEKAGLDDEYARQRADIESQYVLSETPEEQAALDGLLARLDNERDMAIEQLGRGYDQARGQILERQQQATGTGQQELEQLASTFERTYATIAQAEKDAGDAGSLGGIPTGGTPSTGIDGAAARANAGIAAASQARNAITEEDLGWMADMMSGQREAGIGQAQRTAMQVGGQAESAHQRQVSDRINQERMLQAEAFQGLDARFDQRSDGLLGRSGDLLAQLAQMKEQKRQFDAQLAEQQAARRAAAARAGGGGGSTGGGGSGGGSGGPSAAGLQIDPAKLEEHLEYLATPYTRSGEPPNQTRTTRTTPYTRSGEPPNQTRTRTTWDPRQNTPRGR